jgi:hypothetical protein
MASIDRLIDGLFDGSSEEYFNSFHELICQHVRQSADQYQQGALTPDCRVYSDFFSLTGRVPP